MAEQLKMLIRMTQIQFLASTSGGSLLPVTPVPENPVSSSGLCGHSHVYILAHMKKVKYYND